VCEGRILLNRLITETCRKRYRKYTLFTGRLASSCRYRGNRMNTSITRFRGSPTDAPILSARCALRLIGRIDSWGPRADSSSLSSSLPIACSRLFLSCFSRIVPTFPLVPPWSTATLGRLLGSELVRIRPNRAVSSVERERTSATRDAASSP